MDLEGGAGRIVSCLNNWDKMEAQTDRPHRVQDGGDWACFSFPQPSLSRTEDNGLEHKAALNKVC